MRAMVGAMLEAGVSRHLYVVDGQGRLCGSLSVLTALEQLTALQIAETHGHSAKDRAPGPDRPRVRDIMDLRPRYVTRDTPLPEAVQMMLRERLTELPVVDRRMHLLGELRALDILRVQMGAASRGSAKSSPSSADQEPPPSEEPPLSV